ncbi:MAG TPA: hypothetical protein VN039_03365 [Nitrospira sp.]|nr:hypothetical protein [Nitrospira sp.]
MWIAIDTKHHKFLNIRHLSMHVVADLVWLESRLQDVLICSDEWPFLQGMNDIDMHILYKNTSGQAAKYVGDNLRAVLMHMAQQIPERDVNPVELDAQIRTLNEEEYIPRRYVKGVMVPETLPKGTLGSFSAPILLTDEAAIVRLPRALPQVSERPRAAATPQANPSARPARAPSAPRQGGVREVIWAVADRMWEAAGSPKDAKAVLELRKQMMTTLEADHGVKRTSSSNELGQWMKARI